MDFQRYTFSVHFQVRQFIFMCEHFHFREHTPTNLILTVGLLVQAKSPVTTITLMSLDLNYQSKINSDPDSDYPSGLNLFYTYFSEGLYQDRITRPG
ncbi:hypothetical protein F383_32691 [Gossypium arboreum]|uniref:Uncharacterized protein n=1 Tax=Gossypium arboreum TaxID=29729 RepID=A0A0B0PI72_GOSAR|nr:hypothetical protein F383_32691 [Gossypium arboreum]